MTPTKKQRQAAKLGRILEAAIVVIKNYHQFTSENCDNPSECERYLKLAEEAFATFEAEIASREAAAAYAGAMGVARAVQEQPATQPCFDCDHGLCIGFRASIKAAKQAADKLKPKGV